MQYVAKFPDVCGDLISKRDVATIEEIGLQRLDAPWVDVYASSAEAGRAPTTADVVFDWAREGSDQYNESRPVVPIAEVYADGTVRTTHLRLDWVGGSDATCAVCGARPDEEE